MFCKQQVVAAQEDVLPAGRMPETRKKKEMHENESKKTAPGEKDSYQAPSVIRVSLRPEEAVLGHCKVNGSAGPVGGGCRTAGPITCKTIGS